MKNILAENLLRFGVKNLSEADHNSVKTLITEENVIATIYDRPIEMQTSRANFYGAKSGKYGLEYTLQPYDQQNGDYYIGGISYRLYGPEGYNDTNMFHSYTEGISLYVNPQDLLYVKPYTPITRDGAATDWTKIKTIVTGATITNPGRVSGGGDWMKVITTKFPIEATGKTGLNTDILVTCRAYGGALRTQEDVLSALTSKFAKQGGQVRINGKFTAPGTSLKDFTAKINANTTYTPAQKAEKIATFTKNNPTGQTVIEVPWSVTINHTTVINNRGKVGTPSAGPK